MSFPLPRLPLLAIREMIPSMDTREIFLFSLLSKKSQNLVMSSIPKNSLSAKVTFKKNGFLFELMPKGVRNQAANNRPVVPYRTENETIFMRFGSYSPHVQCYWTGTFEIEESIRKLFYRFSKTFKNSKFYMKFEDGTREEFAMKILRFTWENGFPMDEIEFCLKYASPETFQELLNGCNEHHTSLETNSKIPEEFKCTPPAGGYKFESLSVDYAPWVNLDDFLQCRKLFFVIEFPDVTPEYLNGLLKQIVNLECKIERFTFGMQFIKPSYFPEIVRGLSDSAIQQNGNWQGLQFARKDGLKMLVTFCNNHLELDEDYL
ncbi:hypothetical protein CAEBREN_22687 [Caenorhabditis brenneri]|uniref:F-box domain-containing protein n=1 Tax=Caenorhabditis brenneri TaxID=135651 RepID=G0MIJ8_CAEBE|nr:hypothetical protein CAEBREN_22687 [Caenorhabditis brenneri]